MSLDYTLAGTSDQLLSSLDFSLAPSANYVISRQLTQFYPSSGNSMAPTGVQVSRIVLSGTDWLALSSVRIQFTVQNLGNQDFKPRSISPANFFSRVRLLASGVSVDDQWYHNRVDNVLRTLQPENFNL